MVGKEVWIGIILVCAAPPAFFIFFYSAGVLKDLLPNLEQVLDAVVAAMILSGAALIYHGLTKKPSKALTEHRKELLKAYLGSSRNPEWPLALEHSNYKDRLLEHLKSGYSELRIAENFKKWENLQTSLSGSTSRNTTDVSPKLAAVCNAIRDKHDFPRSQDEIPSPPRFVNDYLVLNRILASAGSSDWDGFIVKPTDRADYFHIVNGGKRFGSPSEVFAALRDDDGPQGFADHLNALSKAVEGDVIDTNKKRVESATIEEKFMADLKTALDSAKISGLKGNCQECKSL